MKLHRRLYSRIIYHILFLSLLGVGFSVYKIFSSSQQTNEALKNWENQQLNNKVVVSSKGRKAKGSDLKEGEVIGKITFTSLKVELPIIQGTEEADLERGVGHYLTSALPGGNDNVVLAGHRDGVFSGLVNLKRNDTFRINTSTGTFNYFIISERIVNANDKTVIVHTTEPIVTLITCYPFSFIGPAPERFIIIALQIK